MWSTKMPKFVLLLCLLTSCFALAQQQSDLQKRIDEIELAALRSVNQAPGLHEQIEAIINEGCIALNPKAFLITQIVRGLEGQEVADVLVNLSFRCKKQFNKSAVKNISGILQMRTGTGSQEYTGINITPRAFTLVKLDSLLLH
jgi:hypothetical protein